MCVTSAASSVVSAVARLHVSATASALESVRNAVATSVAFPRATESSAAEPANRSTMRPFHVSTPVALTSSAPHGARSRNLVPTGTVERPATASRDAAARDESRRTSVSTRPMSRNVFLVRVETMNHVSPTGANTRYALMLSASGESRTAFGARFELSVDSGADADASSGGGTGAVSAEATSSESAFARLALVPRDSQDASNANTPTAETKRPKVATRSRRDVRRTQRKVRHVAFSAPRAQLHPDMPPFSYHRPETPDAALAALAADHAVALGGGTDLLLTLREQLVHAEHLVDLRRLPGARDISARDDGSVRLGGAVRIADLASHPVIRGRFAALAEAARSVGTPALRNMGTIAGNLCQRPRCW